MPSILEFAAVLHQDDSVAVLRKPLPSDQAVELPDGHTFLSQSVPAGHKIALRSIGLGDPVVKYGQFIGRALRSIQPGEHVHTHNLEAGAVPARHSATVVSSRAVDLASSDANSNRTFGGFLRPSGKVGTRNYLAVISSVNCSASVSRYVADAFKGKSLQEEFPNIDGVIALTHKSGCAIDPGHPTELLQRVLAGMARHPNIGGYLLIGLGCEVNQVASLVANQQLDRTPAGRSATPMVLNIQQTGGVRKTVEAGIAGVRRLLPMANAYRRTPQRLDKLILALNCGGSDGHSGCTANPALGYASDALVAAGGTSVLAETPEIYGAEHLLAQRAINEGVRTNLLDLVRWWESHVAQFGTTIDNNPSFGNRAGGLTTIYEKSLGAIAKGGQAPLRAVYPYAGEINTSGFCFMDTPGYDPVSMTGLVAGGCNIAVFTTGRGSAYGCKPTPCIKVASNTALYRHQEDDMDINAGKILEGGATVESVGREIFERIIAVAGGERTKSEECGLGDEEFAPWMLGPTL